jgi:outer membrane biosynthesis protein TonB
MKRLYRISLLAMSLAMVGGACGASEGADETTPASHEQPGVGPNATAQDGRQGYQPEGQPLEEPPPPAEPGMEQPQQLPQEEQPPSAQQPTEPSEQGQEPSEQPTEPTEEQPPSAQPPPSEQPPSAQQPSEPTQPAPQPSPEPDTGTMTP